MADQEKSPSHGVSAETTNPIVSHAIGGGGSAVPHHPWAQILLISLICFCLPGMYNALGGLGGSGQVDSTVAANATVALLSTTAATALFIVGPIFSHIGPRACFLVGGWTYALYSGSLLHFNHHGNGTFVIAAGAVLGVGASFLWIVQGAIMTTYVAEKQKGRAIGVFWIIFNLGGGVGSLASFGLNFGSTSGTVSDSTYTALMGVMLLGWLLGLLIADPQKVRVRRLRLQESTQTADNTNTNKKTTSVRETVDMARRTLLNWRVVCMLPLFFCANVFYSYQQNDVNGLTFNMRTRSLNGALYWMAQMAGGLAIGALLDAPLRRRSRAKLGWAVLFVCAMAIWGGGFAFQKWHDGRMARGLKQDLDYTQAAESAGPMVLYVCYGAFDALWQAFCYWLIGADAGNDAARAAVLVGAYKTFQATGGAVAWRLNAMRIGHMAQLAMNWALSVGALLVALPAAWTVSDHTDEEDEGVA